MTSKLASETLGKEYASRYANDLDYLLSDGIRDTGLARSSLVRDIRIQFKDYGVVLIVRIPRTPEGPQVAFYGGSTVFKAALKAFQDLSGPWEKVRPDTWEIERVAQNGDVS